MLGNFTYYNPTRLHFGKDALDKLAGELAQVGPTVQLIYGGGSIKKTGLYDRVMAILTEAGKTVVEDAGVMPNPTKEKLYEGARLARENQVDLLLAVGGGSVVDYAKAVSVSAYCEGDPWQKYFKEFKDPENKLIPLASILTMVGTGSEMNGGSVITNPETHEKIGHVFGPELYPKFSILDPTLTFTVPQYQMVAGFFDIMSHIMEQYFSGEDDNTNDYVMEGLMRSLIHSSRIAAKNPEDYEARSNIMWISTWALNTFVGKGKAQDWQVHMIGQSIGGFTDATHGMTLAAVSPAYYRHIYCEGLPKFVRFAKQVWGVHAHGRSDEEVALDGIACMEEWMREIGLVMSVSELGVTEDMIQGIAEQAPSISTAYKPMTVEEIVEILHESM